jgi:hypothetical protein
MGFPPTKKKVVDVNSLIDDIPSRGSEVDVMSLIDEGGEKKKIGSSQSSNVGITSSARSSEPSSSANTPLFQGQSDPLSIGGLVQPVGTYKKTPVTDFIQQLREKGKVENGVLTIHDNTQPSARIKQPDIKEAIDNSVRQYVSKLSNPTKDEVAFQTKAVTDAYKNGDLVPSLTSDGKSVMKRGTGFWDSLVNGVEEVNKNNLENEYFSSLNKEEKIRHLNLKQQVPDAFNNESDTAPSGILGKTGQFIGENVNMLAKGAVGAMAATVAAPQAAAAGALTGNFGAFLGIANDLGTSGYKNAYERTYYAIKKNDPNVSDQEAADKAQIAGLTGEAAQLTSGAVLSSGSIGQLNGKLAIPEHVAVSANQVLNKALTNVITKEAPKFALTSGGSSLVEGGVRASLGTGETASDVLSQAGEATKEGFKTGLIFGVPHLVATAMSVLADPTSAPSYIRPQMENVAASMPVSAREDFLRSAIDKGILTPDERDAISRKLTAFSNAKEPINQLPISEEKKAAITGKILQQNKLNAEKEQLLKYGSSFNDRVAQLDTQIEGIQTDIAKMYSADDVLDVERDSLTGETATMNPSVIMPDEINRPSETTIAPDETLIPKAEEKKGAAVILPETNKEPNVIPLSNEAKNTESENKGSESNVVNERGQEANLEADNTGGNKGSILDIKSTKKGYQGGFLKEYDFISEGSEHSVYKSKSGETVIKIGEPYNSNETYDARVNDALQIDKLLGDGSLKVIGKYKSDNGTLNPVYSQNYIKGEVLSEAQASEFLENNGFIKEGDGYVINDNGKTYKITDISDNFIKKENGEVVAVDAGIQEIPFNKKYNENKNVIQQQANEGIASNNEPIAAKEEVAPTAEPTKDSEPPKDTEERRQLISVKYPLTEIDYEGTGKLETEFNLTRRTPTERQSDLETQRQANEMLEKGYDYHKLVEEAVSGKRENISDAEVVILNKYADKLANDLRAIKDKSSPHFDATLNQIDRVKQAANIGGREAARTLSIYGRSKSISEDSYAGFFVREKEVNRGAPLTENQKEVVAKEFDAISKAEENATKAISKLKEKENEAKAQSAVKKAFKERKKTDTKERIQKQKKDAIEAAREALKKLRTGESGLSAVPLPLVRELVAVAPHVAKYMKALAQEGVIKLDEVVQKIHSEFKDVVEGISEKDVRDIIAGVYNEKRKPRSELAARLKDIRDEQVLLNKLAAMQRGEEPKNELQKQQRNQRIHELQEKIKDFRKEQSAAASEAKKAEREASKKTPEQIALQSIKTRNEKESAAIQEQLASGDFSEPEKRIPVLENTEIKEQFPELYKEAKDTRDELIKLRNERELRLYREEYRNRKIGKLLYDWTGEVLNVPRTIMSSMDFSAPLRQGLWISVGNHRIAQKAFIEQFRMAKSQARFDRFFADIQESPAYDLSQKSGLYIANPHNPKLSAKEELFMNNLAEKIPVIGKGFKVGNIKVGEVKIGNKKVSANLDLIGGSERAYVGYLNKLRWDVFNKYADVLIDDGKTFENSPETFKALAKYINDGTGRGTIGGTLESAAPLLNSIFFSPRLIASRVNLLTKFANPLFWKSPKEVRLMYLKDFTRVVGLGLTTMALARYGFGAETEDDPRSSDFGKIKSGNTRMDVWGGFLPYIRFTAQLLSGQTKSTTSGRISELNGKGAFAQTRADVGIRFLRGKLAPVPGAAWDLAAGKDVVGQPVTLGGELERNLLPLIKSDIQDAYDDAGMKGVIKVLPSIFGVGVSTYQPKKK